MTASSPQRTLIVTGGAGFIGSCVVRRWLQTTADRIVCVDSLTYAGNLASLGDAGQSSRFAFERADIRDRGAMDRIVREQQPDAIVHLAAESHVDRSIHGPADFIHANVIGTFTLLEAAREYWLGLPAQKREAFRFHHFSTD